MSAFHTDGRKVFARDFRLSLATGAVHGNFPRGRWRLIFHELTNGNIEIEGIVNYHQQGWSYWNGSYDGLI